MTSVYINTEVEIDLDEIPVEELVANLKERKHEYSHLSNYDVNVLAGRVETALAFNHGDDVAIALRDYFEQVHDIKFTDKF